MIVFAIRCNDYVHIPYNYVSQSLFILFIWLCSPRTSFLLITVQLICLLYLSFVHYFLFTISCLSSFSYKTLTINLQMSSTNQSEIFILDDNFIFYFEKLMFGFWLITVPFYIILMYFLIEAQRKRVPDLSTPFFKLVIVAGIVDLGMTSSTTSMISA